MSLNWNTLRGTTNKKKTIIYTKIQGKTHLLEHKGSNALELGEITVEIDRKNMRHNQQTRV